MRVAGFVEVFLVEAIEQFIAAEKEFAKSLDESGFYVPAGIRRRVESVLLLPFTSDVDT